MDPPLHRDAQNPPLIPQNTPTPRFQTTPAVLPTQSSKLTEQATSKSDEDEDSDDHKVVETDPSNRFERYNLPLGKGAYKEVYKAFDQEEGVEVAWNQLRVDHLHRKETQRILHEIQILQSLRNDNIINLFHSWICVGQDRREKVCFITELMTSGTLKSYIRKTKGAIKPKILKNWARQILNGLHYLHSRQPPIIHRDLKCENIFINGNNGQAKIGDLGLATIKHREHASSVLGTPEFMAPELYDERYDEKVDIYAFGMVVLEIVTKEYPYAECTNQAQIYKKVTSGIKPAAIHKVTDDETRAFIEVCIAYNPDHRPPAEELLRHPFLTAVPVSGVSSAMTSSSNGSLGAESLEGSMNASMASVMSFDNMLDQQPSIGKLNLDMNSSPNDVLSLNVTPQPPSTQVVDGSNHSYHVTGASTDASSMKPSPHLTDSSVSSTMSPTGSLSVEVESQTEDTVHLKMTYTWVGRKPQEIKFPFSLKSDTVTDVVSEMVNEKLIDARDEGMTRRKLEEVVRSVLMSSRGHSGTIYPRNSDTSDNDGSQYSGPLNEEQRSLSSDQLTRVMTTGRLPTTVTAGIPTVPETNVTMPRRNSMVGLANMGAQRRVSSPLQNIRPKSPQGSRSQLSQIPLIPMHASPVHGSRPTTPKEVVGDVAMRKSPPMPLYQFVGHDGSGQPVFVQQQVQLVSQPGRVRTSSVSSQTNVVDSSEALRESGVYASGASASSQVSSVGGIQVVSAQPHYAGMDVVGELSGVIERHSPLLRPLDLDPVYVDPMVVPPVMTAASTSRSLDPEIHRKLEELQEMNLRGLDNLNLSQGKLKGSVSSTTIYATMNNTTTNVPNAATTHTSNGLSRSALVSPTLNSSYYPPSHGQASISSGYATPVQTLPVEKESMSIATQVPTPKPPRVQDRYDLL